MQKVKRLIAAGASPAAAFKESLGASVADFARREGLHATAVYGVLNGSARTPYNEVRDRIAGQVGVDREWLDSVLPLPQSDAA